MAYVIIPGSGLAFGTPKYPNCVVAAYDTGGVGEVVFVGTAPVGSIEYDALRLIWGPDDMTAAGEAGPFLNALVGPVNDAIKLLPDWQQAANLPPWIYDAALPGNAPVTVQNVNIGLRQYFKIPAGVMSFTPYP